MNKVKLYTSLVNEYGELNEKINGLDTFISSLDFEDRVPDLIERTLLKGKLRCMCDYRDNLKAQILCVKTQIKKEENDRQALNDWLNMKGKVVNTPSNPVRLVNTDEQHHCGQDADDACCQARNNNQSPATISVQDPNESQPIDLPVSIKDLLGMQVVSVGDKHCDGCPADNYGDNCVKVELAGGFYLCLSPLSNSFVTE